MAATNRALLIIEDSEDDAKHLKTLLEQGRIANPIEVVYRVDDAIALIDYVTRFGGSLEHPAIGVVFLDLKMPGRNGFQFLEWLNDHPEHNDILVVVVSGLDDLASIRRAYASGADSFLTKPCSLVDLENLIRWFPQYWDRAPVSAHHGALSSA